MLGVCQSYNKTLENEKCIYKKTYLTGHWFCSCVVIRNIRHSLKVITDVLSTSVVHLTHSIGVIVVERETSMMAETPN